MNKIIFDKILHSGRLHGLFRRGMALTLAAAMVLPMTSAMAATEGLRSLMHKADAPYPDVEIEGNFVRDEFGFFTGYFELGLRVKTPEDKRFQSLGVTLEYDANLLTPVDWETAGKEIAIEGSRYYTVDLPTQQSDKIDTAAARGGNPATPAEDISEGLKDGNRKVLTFTARSYEMVEFATMTTIAAIRFKVKDTLLDKLKITKRGTDDYDISYDGVEVTDVASLQAAMTPTDGPAVPVLMGFPCDADTFFTGSDIKMALDYHLWDKADGGNHYEYYFIPDYKYLSEDDTTYTKETQTIGGKKYTLHKPITKNGVVLAVEPTIDESANTEETGTEGKYSYLSNLIQDVTGSTDPNQDHTYITFPIVSKRSFMDTEDKLGNLTTIVYVDWDNTLLGTQVVPKNTDTQTFDLRGMVSDYVADQFIYHDNDDTTYGLNDLNAPTLAEMKSQDRLYNYRGKYPADTLAEDNTTIKTIENVNIVTTVKTGNATVVDENPSLPNGSEYPLTNKLDYSFFKRPMERELTIEPDPNDYENGEENPQYIADLSKWNTWKQSSDLTSGDNDTAGVVASYDVEHPFAYGWAKCTAKDYENVWTTLGSTGELKSYAVDANGIASVTYDGGENFEFADLQNGFSEDTVFLKAIYEPGDQLLGGVGINYRMVAHPYYNKTNTQSSSLGGAYSIDVVFERSTVQIGDVVHGVVRLREPVVRQETSFDYKWKVETEKGVNHNLENTGNDDTYKNKYENTYTKVEVENKDKIAFTLTLSARQNKVDYYIVEAYASNFVAGPGMTDNDSLREEKRTAESSVKTAYATMDNYNYYVQGESADDGYYDSSRYEDREGSRGFVLYGTLNKIMQAATQFNAGEITDAEFENITSEENLKDANLFLANKTVPTSPAEWTLMRSRIRGAAAAAKELYDNFKDDTYWNTDPAYDCAWLTYHQLQGYILDERLDHDTKDSFDALTWCHLHDECVSANSGIPTDWDSLIAAAKNDPDQIDALNPTSMETMAHLRKSSSGEGFDSLEEIKAALVDAVGQGYSSWDEIQDYIIRKQTPDIDYAKANYWWYDGATSKNITSWNELLAAAKAANGASDAPLAPGESAPTIRIAKLNQFEETYEANNTSLNNDGEPATMWLNATENLCITEDGQEGQPFGSFADFKTALTNALAAAQAAGTNTPDWYQIQYMILNPAKPFPKPYGETDAPVDYAGYWWHNGAVRVTNFETLLKAARDANMGKTTSLDNFKLEDLYNPDYKGTDKKPGLGFRASFDAVEYTASSLEAENTGFKALVMKYVNAEEATPTWNRLQYYLIHAELPEGNVALNREADYYWWKNGGEAEAVDFTSWQSNTAPAERADALAVALMDAAFRAHYNGNKKAWDQLNAAALESGRIAQNWTGMEGEYPGDFTRFADADLDTELKPQIIALMEKISKKSIPVFPAPTATWETIQYYLIKSGYPADADVTATYWWKSADKKPEEKDPPEVVFGELVGKIEKVAKGDAGAEEELKSWFTEEIAAYLEFNNLSMPISQAELDSLSWSSFDYVTAGCLGGDGTFTITWYQVEFIFLSPYVWGMYWLDTDANAAMYSPMYGATAPGWAAANGYSLNAAPLMMVATAASVPEQLDDLIAQIKQLTESIQEEPAMAQEYAQQIADLLAAVDALKEQLAALETPALTETPAPTESEEPTEPPAPTEEEEPTAPPSETESEKPSDIEEESPEPSPSQTPEDEPAPTPTPTQPPATETESSEEEETSDPSTEQPDDTKDNLDETTPPENENEQTGSDALGEGSADGVETQTEGTETSAEETSGDPSGTMAYLYQPRLRSKLLSTRVVAKTPPNLRSPNDWSRLAEPQFKIFAIGRISS